MIFTSIEYFVFLCLTLLAFYNTPQRYCWIVLLCGNYLFYGWHYPQQVFLLLAVTGINFYAGKKIGSHPLLPARKRWLAFGVGISLLLLAIFKYSGFVSVAVNDLMALAGFDRRMPYINLLLPLGISFYTFQAIGYTIDVYRNNNAATRNPTTFGLFVSFFPQLISGPIERSRRLLPQFLGKQKFSYDMAIAGFQLILIGLFKKLVIADRVAIYVDKVYGAPELFSGSTLFMATLFYSVQIYCDFSGYTDIAIGSAKLFGFDLMQNFKQPYFAKSLSEFWQRWHISLSTWFRDYLYIPLGGNRVLVPRWTINIIIVFAISGLWHGASWTFILWGIFHGLGLVAERLFFGKSPSSQGAQSQAITKYRRAGSIAAVFIFVSIGWVFFRADTLLDIGIIFRGMIGGWGDLYIGNPSNFIFSLIGIALLVLYDVDQEWYKRRLNPIFSSVRYVRHASYALLFVGILMIGVFDESQFIYFQF